MAVSVGLLPELYSVDGTTRVAILENTSDAHIVDETLTDTNGQEVLDFTMPKLDTKAKLINNEMQIRFGGSAFRVRTSTVGWEETGIQTYQIHCEALFYDLGDADAIIVASTTSCSGAMTTILAGSGWTLGTITAVSGGTFQVSDRTNPLAALRALPGTFGGELVFNNVTKTVSLVSVRGDQTGNMTYGHGLNLAGASRQTDTTSLFTRVRPIGASGIDISTVNSGVPYLDDQSWYTGQGLAGVVRATPVTNDQISDPNALIAWGRAQLAALSKPRLTYTTNPATVVGATYPGLGDLVRVFDRDLSLNLFTRVIKRDTYPLQPWRSTVTLDSALHLLTDALTGIVGTSATPVASVAGQPPATPTGVTIASAQAVDATGFSYTYALISWNPVTTNFDGTPIVALDHYFVEYQIDGGQWTPLGNTTRTTIQTPPFRANATVSARVQAVTTGNVGSGFGTSSTVAVKDTQAPNTPSTPTLSTRLPLAIEVAWNGNDNVGGAMPGDFARTEVHLAQVSGFSPISQPNAPLLTGDASTFEGSVGGWTPFSTGGTVARSTTHAHTGTGAMLLTTTSTAGFRAISPLTAVGTVNPGDAVDLGAWVFSTVSANVLLAADCYTTLGTKTASVSGQSFSIAPNVWTFLHASCGPAPTGTSRMAARVGFFGPTSNGQQLWVDDVSLADPVVTLFDSINNPAGGISVATKLTNGVTYWIGLRTVDLTGNISPMSPAVSARAQLIPAGSYADLSIADANIGSLNVGKLVAGVLNADVVIGSRIKTADSGARMEINSAGLKAYNSSGTNTVSINSDGSASFTGTITASTIIGSTIETASSGARMVIVGTGGSTWLEFFSGITGETPGFVQGGTSGSGASTAPTIALQTGFGSGATGVTLLDLQGMSADGTTRPQFSITSDDQVAGHFWTDIFGTSGPTAAISLAVTAVSASTVSRIQLDNTGLVDIIGSLRLNAGQTITNWGYGSYSGTTDGSGNLVVTHGMGVTPTHVYLTPVTPNSGANQGFPLHTATSSTTFTVRYNPSAGSMNSVAVTGRWLAIKT